MHEKGTPVLYGPRITLIVLSPPSTSRSTSSLVSPVLMAVSVLVTALLFEDVGSFSLAGIDMCEADGTAFCFEKAVIGFGDRDLDLT